MNHFFVLLSGLVSFLGFIPPSFSQTLPPCGVDFGGVESILSAPNEDQTNNILSSNARMSDMVRPYDVFCSSSGLSTGFMFENQGINAIIPTQAIPDPDYGPWSYSRQFEFRYRDRARQDITMAVMDDPAGVGSQFMESEFFFFPRKVLPAIQWPAPGSTETTFKVILPTNEEVIFDTQSKTMVGGVLKETAPIDVGPNRFTRKFAQISYSGTGVYFRVDKRGAEPRVGTTATIYQGDKICKRPAAELFDQSLANGLVFLFPTDEGFNAFLQKKCQMSF